MILTKEELLQKGISEEVADEILAAASLDQEDSLQALSKALKVEEPLAKAKGGDDDDDEENGKNDDDDYDEKYMKKYMKRYMKENKESVSKMGKEAGIWKEKMEKAIDGIDLESDAAIIQTTDLKPYLDSQKEFNSEMIKAVSEIYNQIEIIKNQNKESYGLMHKAAKVQFEQANSFNEYLNISNGRKGTVATTQMQKSSDTIDKKIAYRVLQKAVFNKDRKAGEIISKFESSGQNFNILTGNEKEYVKELIQKGAN